MSVRPLMREERGVEPDLASLVASRLCHDLVSPIGAIGNGVELLGMSGVAGPEMDLISQSVEGASARVRFFRVALGSADPDQTVESAQLSAILTNPERGGKLRMGWAPAGPIPRPDAKLAFLMLMCAESAFVHGGEALASSRDHVWRVDARGAGMKADPALWSVLTGGAGPVPVSATVHFALTAAQAAATGRVMSVDMGPDSVSIHAQPR